MTPICMRCRKTKLIYLAYEDVISALIRGPKDVLKLSGVRKFFADYLGVLPHQLKEGKRVRADARPV